MSVTVSSAYFPGTSCQDETAVSFEAVGAQPRHVFIADVLDGRTRLDDADLLCIPGGFSHGDHIASGVVAAKFLTTRLADQLAACRKRPMICICNGFQIAVRAGLFGEDVALAVNDIGTFNHVTQQEHYIEPEHGNVWLKGLEGQTLRFPCAHGEGRFIHNSPDGWRTAIRYPADRNPDGSADNIAGITTPDGLVLGLMNHPERTRNEANLEIFRNGVRAAS